MKVSDEKKKGVVMKIFPTEFEITDDVDEHICKFEAFDDESFIIHLREQIYSPQDLVELADVLDKCTALLKKGIHDADSRKE